MQFVARLGVSIIAISGIAVACFFAVIGMHDRNDAITKLKKTESYLDQFYYRTENENVIVTFPNGQEMKFPSDFSLPEIWIHARDAYRTQLDYELKVDVVEQHTREAKEGAFMASLSLVILITTYFLSCLWIWICLGHFSFAVLKCTNPPNSSICAD